MHIAIRSPNWIGDCVMALPAIRALKYWFPESRISLVSKIRLRDIFLNMEEIDNLIPVSNRDNFRTLISDAGKLRKYHFDEGILFTNSFRSALLFRMARVKKLAGYRYDGRGVLLRHPVPFPRNHNHHRFFYLDLVEHFVTGHISGIDFDGSVFSDELSIDGVEKKSLESQLKFEGIDWGKGLIGISPSAAYGSAKEWPPDRFGELIGRLLRDFPDFSILLFGSEKEKERVDRIGDRFPRNVYSLAGRFSLRESIVTMSYCRLFVSNDSGLMHVAASLKIPVLGIFGPTVPEKTAPFQGKARIFFHPVACSPCHHRECPADHRCMKAVGVDEVYDAAREILREMAPGPAVI